MYNPESAGTVESNLSATIIANTMYFVNVKDHKGKALNSLASSPFLLILYSVSITL